MSERQKLSDDTSKPGTIEDFERDFIVDTSDPSNVLGTGGFSTVRRCTRRADKASFAVKIAPYLVKDDIARTSSQRDVLFREAEISALCKAPQIVEFQKFFVGTSEIYLVFELISGGELFDAIVQKEHFSEREASACIRDLLLAVQVCHSNNVIHRDVKPENLLLTEDGHFKLADFGLATIAREPGYHGFCGTPAYMAPELVCSRHLQGDQPRAKYDQGVDIWASGVILYILLVGYQPFWSDDTDDLYQQILHTECDYSDDWYSVSSPAKELVKSMICRDTSKRITVDAALSSSWIRDSEKTAASTHRATALKNLRTFNARRKFRAGVTAVRAAGRVKRASLDTAKAAEVASSIKSMQQAEASSSPDSDGATKDAVIAANQQLLDAIVSGDWQTYTRLVDPKLTCFEPEAPGTLVEGLNFHKFYFDLPRDEKRVPPHTTLVDMRVTLLGPGAALMTYIRLTQAVMSNGAPFTMKSEETRVWRKDCKGGWICVHFHRSGSPSAPHK